MPVRTQIAEDIKEKFPSLPLHDWEKTKETLHLYIQIAGKIRLALAPRKNHWWNITLRINSRGIGTTAIPYKDMLFEINFDFIDHQVYVQTSEGEIRSFSLYDGLSVAEFNRKLFYALSQVGIEVKILGVPYDIKSKTPFAIDTEHQSYDKNRVHIFWKILQQIDGIFKEFSGRFNGKCSPVQLFWHSFDLAVTRFSGKSVPEMKDTTRANREAYSHEVISAGFWFGDDLLQEPAFYSYTYPLPDGITQEPLIPEEAAWREYKGSPMALYMYEDMRKSREPRKSLLDFLESSYLAGARRAGWNIEEFTIRALK